VERRQDAASGISPPGAALCFGRSALEAFGFKRSSLRRPRCAMIDRDRQIAVKI
jgi:hypothetical protein